MRRPRWVNSAGVTFSHAKTLSIFTADTEVGPLRIFGWGAVGSGGHFLDLFQAVQLEECFRLSGLFDQVWIETEGGAEGFRGFTLVKLFGVDQGDQEMR